MTISTGSSILSGDDITVRIVRNGEVSQEPLSKIFKGRKVRVTSEKRSLPPAKKLVCVSYSEVNMVYAIQVALFGLPGAFTGVCSARHLPEFIQNVDKFKSKVGIRS